MIKGGNLDWVEFVRAGLGRVGLWKGRLKMNRLTWTCTVVTQVYNETGAMPGDRSEAQLG